ncbi:insulin like growth factor binding protein acid labile subunit convoluted [Arctopsyche grandis]|uniref:insulin like growth factor binding protein acid labile subunit convoluted n=1 Tax=Arctopsyche grandis TaxID=121162 RepID=UPI00406D6BE1
MSLFYTKHLWSIFVFVLLYWKSQCCAEYIPPGPLYRCPPTPEKMKLLHPCVCDQGTDSGLYVTCMNSGLATLSIGLSNLASLKMPIEQLIISDCNIARLYGPLFHKLKVRILKIENTPIAKIEEETFMGVNKTLQDFYLIHSKLEVFPKEAFKILGNLTILYIDQHFIKNLDKDIFADSSSVGKLERLHLINGNLTELTVESFQPLRKLKTLDLHGNKLVALKKNQFKGLRDVEVLDISYNNITKLDSSHIADLTKLSWCNVSHNHLAELPRGMFARNAVLRVLHMNHNKLKRLDTNSFRGMRFLRRLYLSDNQISDVGRGTFGSVTRIGTIDLARNKIKKIDFQMFSELNYVEIIDVSENQITEIQKQSFKNLYLTNINISHNALSKIEVGSFENCANITVLDLSHNNLTQIVPRAFDITTYATEFLLSFNQLTALNQVPLQNMTGLKILNVSYNAITTIPKSTFPKLYELHTVDISHNQLKEIASAVFQPLFSLRLLNLSHNMMEQIKPPTFGTLPTVLNLDLSHNLLKDVSRGALSNLASCRNMDVSHNMLQKIFMMPISLGEFDLSYNNISEIPANTWPTMNALLKLDLSYNPLSGGLFSESFRGLLTLQTLVLTGTSQTKPPWEALSPLSSLQYVKLNKNNLTSLNKAAFGRLPIVFDLDLSDNQINNVSIRAFDGLLQLLALSLRNNNIYYIPNGAFFGLVSLRSLDLSQNHLERIENKTNGLLDDCLSLDRVNLSYNKISFIGRKSFPSDPYIPYNLKEIDLSHNVMPVITSDLMFGTKKLQVLNISNNILNDIRKNVIGNLTSLRLLDLSNNGLNDLTSDKELFRLPPNINIINLSNNALLRLPINHLHAAPNLTILDVRNNTLEYFDDELVDKMKNKNLQVHFGGNPLSCDCFTRPLKHFLNRLPKKDSSELIYSDIICALPLTLKDAQFLSVTDDRLNCIENVAVREKLEKKTGVIVSSTADYNIEADLVFRDVHFSQDSILIRWYVQTSKDLADFHVVIRNTENKMIYSKTILYNERQILINLDDNAELKSAVDEKSSKFELCMLAGDSATGARRWFQSQCTTLPEDFSVLKREDLTKRKIVDNNTRRRKIRLQSVASAIFPNLFVIFFGCIFTMYYL